MNVKGEIKVANNLILKWGDYLGCSGWALERRRRQQKCLKEMYDNEGRGRRDFQHEGDPDWDCRL